MLLSSRFMLSHYPKFLRLHYAHKNVYHHIIPKQTPFAQLAQGARRRVGQPKTQTDSIISDLACIKQHIWYRNVVKSSHMKKNYCQGI